MQPLSSSLPLVGRRAELAALSQAYDSVSSGMPRFVLVGGEAGIGKTRLIGEFVGDARRRGATVLEGAAPALSGPDLPYAPIVAALRGLANQFGSERLASLFPPEAELSRLLPHRSVAHPVSQFASGSQLRLYEEFFAFFTSFSAADDGPLVLVLEDLHWADASTRGLLAYLVRNMSSGRVLVVASYRSTDANPSSALQEMLMELDRSEAVRQLYLDALPDEDAEALIRSILGAAVPDDWVHRIAHRSGGNPLFIEKLAAADVTDSSVAPRSLVALLHAVVGRLPPDAQSLVRLAAVAGTAAPASVIESAARATGIELSAAVRAARDAGILTVVSVADGDVYAYRHPILQEVLYADLPQSERARLHGLLARVMDGQNGVQAHDPVTAIELARHWWAAGDGRRAYPALLAAAHAAEGMYAFPEAHQLYERALVLQEDGAEVQNSPRRQIGFRSAPAERTDHAELSLATAQAASLAGHPERAVELLQARLREAAAHDAPTLGKLGLYLWESGRRDESLVAYEQAVERASDTAGRAKSSVLRAAARAFLLAGDAARAVSIAREAVTSAQQARLEPDESSSLSTLAASLALTGAVDEAVRVLEQRRELNSRRQQSGIRPRPSRIVDLLSGYWSQATVLERAGQFEESASVALEGVQRAKELGGQRGWGGLVGAAAVRELTELGRWGEAEALLSDLMSGAAASSGVEVELHAAAARLLTMRGDFKTAVAHLDAAGDEDTWPPRIRGALALASGDLAVWSGQLSEASRAIGDALQTVGPASDRLLVAELLVMGLRSTGDRAATADARRLSAERAAIEREAAQLNSELLTLVVPSGVQVSAGGRKLEALMATGAAEYDRLTGRGDADGWLAVAALWERVHQPFQAAYARWRAAEAQLGPPIDRQGAQRELAAAHATCLALGSEPLRREIEALARRARIDLAGPEPEDPHRDSIHAAIAAPALGLSPRELEVLMLVSEGWTNRRIADALFITEKTAGHHVSSILGKLGVASRVEAASVAIRAGLVQSPVIATAPEPTTSNVEADDRPRLTRTLFFSDIVKSTALVEAMGDDAWRDVITWHDVTLRSLFRSYAGTEVDHAGDGFFVVFADIIAGLDCAIAIQRTLANHRKQHGFAPRLRIGIHTADVIKVGDGYRGKGVHEAARIAATAAPDEILASSSSLPPAARYLTLQPRIANLSGLTAPTSVVPVSWQQDPDPR